MWLSAGKFYPYRVLGLPRSCPSTLSRKGKHSNKCKTLCCAEKWTEACNSQKMEGKIVTVFFCCTIPAFILLPIPRKPFRNWKLEALDHPLYRPDLSASDFYLFGHLKEAVRDGQFADDDNSKTAFHGVIWQLYCVLLLPWIHKLCRKTMNIILAMCFNCSPLCSGQF
jgi:hypothetical protein